MIVFACPRKQNEILVIAKTASCSWLDWTMRTKVLIQAIEMIASAFLTWHKAISRT